MSAIYTLQSYIYVYIVYTVNIVNIVNMIFYDLPSAWLVDALSCSKNSLRASSLMW